MAVRGLFASFVVVCALGLGLCAGQSTAQQTETRLFDVFKDADSVDMSPAGLAQLADAIRQAKLPRECPLGELTIFVGKGDPLFQKALAAARRDALLAWLEAQGLNVAGRLFVELSMSSVGARDTGYTAARDDKRPSLKTTSTLPKGKKVKEGDRIAVTMVARDDADRYQTGVKTVQLVADSEGGRFIASENYRPCSEPKEKRVQATYTVPVNPPPVVRLTALAEDHAGLTVTDSAEFPTGDWYGTLEWSFESRVKATAHSAGVTSKRVGRADLAMRQRRDGTVEGGLSGSQTYDNWWGYADRSKYCVWKTKGPQEVRARLDGMYEATRGYPMLQASNVQAAIRAELVESHECTSPPDQSDFGTELTSMLPILVHKLTRTGDNVFTARLDISNAGARDRLIGHYGLTLRRATD